MKDLENDFNKILDHFYYGAEKPEVKTERLVYGWQTPDGNVRHNFQRQKLRNQSYICIYYRDMLLAKAERWPDKCITIQDRLPSKAPKGYFATKVLERVLWYRFPGVRVK